MVEKEIAKSNKGMGDRYCLFLDRWGAASNYSAVILRRDEVMPAILLFNLGESSRPSRGPPTAFVS